MTYRITMDDLRVAGYCASGVRAFVREHNLDLSKLVHEGLTEADVAHIDDAHVTRAIEIAKEREQE